MADERSEEAPPPIETAPEQKPCKRGKDTCEGPRSVRYACEVPNRIYDAIPCGIAHYTADEPHRLVFVNKLGCSILGYDDFEQLAACCGDQAFAHVLPEDLDSVEETARELRAGRPIVEFHHRFRHHDGSVRWLRGKAALVEDGEHPIVQTAFRDVTSDHQMQSKRDRERLTKVLFQAFSEVFEINLARDTCRLIGSSVGNPTTSDAVTINEALKQWTEMIVHQDDRDRVIDAVRRFSRNLDAPPLALTYRLALNTRTIWCRSLFLRVDEDGFLCCNNDVTDRMRHEDEAISRGIGDLVARLPLGVAVYQVHETTIVPLYVSDPVCEMFGLSREEYDARIEQGMPAYESSHLSAWLEKFDLDGPAPSRFTIDTETHREDGTPFSVRVRGSLARARSGELALYAALLDITDELRSQRELAWQNERFRILSELTHAISFDYDFGTDTALLYLDEGDGMKAHVIGRYLADLESVRVGVIHPDSIGSVRNLFSRVQNGEHQAQLDFRADYFGTGFSWYRANLFKVDDGGDSWHLIGLIEDIQEERDLQHLAELDQMVGINNNATMKRLVTQALTDPAVRAGSVCALLDVDDFKNVNDHCGHLKGDELLCSIGSLMRDACRDTDIVGRIGGDEFALFFKGMSLESAMRRLETIRERVTALAARPGFDAVSVSIGACGTTERDRTYDDVFSRADEALYASKRAGKNRITAYGRPTG